MTAGFSIHQIRFGKGQSLALPAASELLVVLSGRFEVYAQVEARRIFLGQVGAGSLIAPPDRVMGLMTVLAVEDGSLHPLDQAMVERIPPDMLGAAVDGWCATLSAALGRLAGRDRPEIASLPPGEGLDVPGGGAVTAAHGVVWAQFPGGEPALLMGLAPLPSGMAVPLSHQAWLSVSAGGRVDGLATPSQLEQWGQSRLTELARALGGHMAVVMEAAGRLCMAVEALEYQRVERRDRQVEKDLAHGVGRFTRILTDNSLQITHQGDFPFVYQAVTGQPPAPESAKADCPDFERFAAMHGARLRAMPLQGRWWKKDTGPLIVRRRADDRPAAAVTDWLGRYRLHVHGEKPVRVNEQIAAALHGEAHILTRPLPNRPLAARDVIVAGLVLCSFDLGTLAAAMLAAAGLGLLMPIATGVLIDTYIPASMRGPTLIIGIGLLLAQVLNSVINLSSGVLRLRMDGRIAEFINAGVMDRMMRLPSSLTRTMATSDLASRIAAVENFRKSLMGMVLNALMSGITGLAGIVLLLYHSAPAGGIALVLVALLVLIAVAAGARQVKSFYIGEQMTASVTSLTHQVIENMSVLRAFAAERRAFARWAANSAEMRARALRAKGLGNLFEAFLAAYQIIAVAVVFAVLGLSLGPDSQVGTGSFMVFVTTFQGFLSAGVVMARGANQAFNMKPQIMRAEPLLKNAPESPPHAKDAGQLSGALDVGNVVFGHDPQKPILNGVSFSVEPGGFIALVGPSGSGKSTLMSLLVGFEKPQQGAIRYDGRDLGGLDLTSLRRQIGFVRQHGRLFSGSLRENILGPNNAEMAEVWNAAELAGIADDIKAMPMGMHTVVTEGTQAFSGGQIQRLLLARALMGRPKFLFLDEATSALDNLSQAKVTQSIDRLGITRLVVAHRLSTVRNADVILFMDQGRIVEHGTFTDLIARDGAFSRFARLQAMGPVTGGDF